MAEKSSQNHRFKPSGPKTVTLHHYHSKPYRKRHIGLLIFLFASFIILLITAVQYRLIQSNSINISENFVSDLFTGEKKYDLKVHSTYGFDITYDQQKFYASAIDAKTGDVYVSSDLSESRPYGMVRIAPSYVDSRTSQSSLTMTYHQETT